MFDSFSLSYPLQTSLLNPLDPSDKRPKLERARSAAEKENHPLQRAGSQLRRQYSQQETSTQRRASASDSGVDDPYLQRSHPANVDGQYLNQSPQSYRNNSNYYQGSSTGYPPENDPRYYQVSWDDIPSHSMWAIHWRKFKSFQGEIEDLMRTHPHLVHPRQQSFISQQQQSHSSYLKPQRSHEMHPHQYGSHNTSTSKRPLGGAPYLHQQRSFSSSEEELRSTPEFDGELIGVPV